MYYFVEYAFSEALFISSNFTKYTSEISGFNVHVLKEHNIVWLGVKPDPLYCNLVQLEDLTVSC